MKKSIVLMLISILCVTKSFSQDVLNFRNGTIKKGTIKEITATDIKYNRIGNTTALYTISKEELLSVKFKDGTLEVFDVKKKIVEETTQKVTEQKVSEKVPPLNTQSNAINITTNTPINQEPLKQSVAKTSNTSLTKKDYSDMFNQGRNDAKIYYKGYKGAGTGTFLTSFLLSPIVGLIPAVACSSTQPSMNNVIFPNVELTHNSDYVNGYLQEAHTKKIKKVWGNFGIATGILAIVAISVKSSYK